MWIGEVQYLSSSRKKNIDITNANNDFNVMIKRLTNYCEFTNIILLILINI